MVGVKTLPSSKSNMASKFRIPWITKGEKLIFLMLQLPKSNKVWFKLLIRHAMKVLLP